MDELMGLEDITEDAFLLMIRHALSSDNGYKKSEADAEYEICSIIHNADGMDKHTAQYLIDGIVYFIKEYVELQVEGEW